MEPMLLFIIVIITIIILLVVIITIDILFNGAAGHYSTVNFLYLVFFFKCVLFMSMVGGHYFSQNASQFQCGISKP